ncbi:MAG: ribosome biogenesis GTP-binding protein YihA/YsxC [Porphyromonas sp.]|nr:ribosome biogenesis GTP-binding protein YihA/YsxC [Porphyromonas sp.]
MTIKTAEFIKSSAEVSQCPPSSLPEYAFIGRSNVGKSSLINSLTGQRTLAKTSQKPGKTQLINHFLINKEWHMVDLPGYGYASRGKSQRLAFSTMIMSYMAQRQELTCLFILIDSRLEPQKIDLDFINQMGENGVPFALVFTKADKLSNAALKRSVERYCQRLSEEWEELPPLFVTSSVKGTGREELLNYIESINQSIQEQ